MAKNKRTDVAEYDEKGQLADPVQILARARQGDESVLPQLRKLLTANPKLWLGCGDLSSHVLTTWINLVAGKDLALRESLRLTLLAMRYSLDGRQPTQLETLVVDRILATWLQLQLAETEAAVNKDADLPRAMFYLRRQESAERRHLAAIRQLALVRRLLPAVPAAEKANDNGQDKPKNGKALPRVNGHARKQWQPENRLKVFFEQHAEADLQPT